MRCERRKGKPMESFRIGSHQVVFVCFVPHHLLMWLHLHSVWNCMPFPQNLCAYSFWVELISVSCSLRHSAGFKSLKQVETLVTFPNVFWDEFPLFLWENDKGSVISLPTTTSCLNIAILETKLTVNFQSTVFHEVSFCSEYVFFFPCGSVY